MSTTFQPPPTGVPIMMDDPLTAVPTISVIWQKYFVDMAALLTSLGATVTSFNTRTGAIILTANDVTTALTFTPAALTPIDGTADATDRVLGVGQSKFINVSAATSIPLYVACGDGQEYEVTFEKQTWAGTATNASLNPNNTTYASAISDVYFYGSSGTGAASGSATVSTLVFALGTPSFVTLNISTSTTRKHTRSVGNSQGVGITYIFQRNQEWNDTTTVYSSLGTVQLGSTWTGRILIRRIA